MSNNQSILEDLYIRLGRPAYFWPAVITTIFVVLPCVASALEAML
jgi:hypothetical protein